MIIKTNVVYSYHNNNITTHKYMKTAVIESNTIKIPHYQIDVESGQYSVTEDVEFECEGGYSIDAKVTIWLDGYNEEEVNYSETRITDVYIHNYKVWLEGEELDIEIDENEIKSKITI